MSQILASLKDANIYDRDLVLLRPGNWLNDSCINYCLRQLEIQISEEAFLLLDPAVVSFLVIQCTDDDEYADLSSGLELSMRKWIFVPINNSDSFSVTSTHWSLLVVHVDSGKSFHFDSGGNHNRKACETTALKIFQLLRRTDRPEIKFITECPQQNNSYDCGIYLLLFANFLAVNLLTKDAMREGFDGIAWNDIIARLDVTVTEEHATSFRKRIYAEITNSMKTSVSWSHEP